MLYTNRSWCSVYSQKIPFAYETQNLLIAKLKQTQEEDNKGE